MKRYMDVIANGCLLLSLCAPGCRGLARMPQIEVPTGSRGAVIVLTGIEDDDSEQEYPTSTLEPLIRATYPGELSAQTFNRFESCGGYRGLDCICPRNDRDRGRAERNSQRGVRFAEDVVA